MAIVAGLFWAAASVTAQAQPAAPAAAQPTIQQSFDRAEALDAGKDGAASLAAWEALEARTGRNKRSHAIVLLRKSAALLRLGRLDQADRAARAGLADLSETDASLRTDRANGYLTLAGIAANSLDYASAAGFYAQAEQAADTPNLKVGALYGLIKVQTFVDPAAATAALARADAVLAGATVADGVRGRFRDLKARLLLNQGNFVDARTEARNAVALVGGMTSKTDLIDVTVRSDAAIAAMLAGKRDEARRYMAMTGAGRLPKGSFDPGAQMRVPDCGGDAGLKPEDMAIVEFSIGESGAVNGATPIYAAGGGPVALEFVRAVRDWTWTPEQIKDLPAFFRHNSRVEMRCSTAFTRPAISDLFDGALEQWLESKGFAAEPEGDGSDAVRITAERARLASVQAAHGADALAIVPALSALAANVVVGREERHQLAVRVTSILAAHDAPAMARLRADLIARTSERADGFWGDAYQRMLGQMVASEPYATDPAARSALRLYQADAMRPKSRDRARALLVQIDAETALPANDPVRVGALVRLASLDEEAGDRPAARAAFERTGLSANQCAILDAPPKFLSTGGTFPTEAMEWGFEGWTKNQFDVAADGRVLNSRAILSYPPFVFTEAGTETIATSRFAKSFRPDGGLGCGGTTRQVRFLMP